MGQVKEVDLDLSKGFLDNAHYYEEPDLDIAQVIDNCTGELANCLFCCDSLTHLRLCHFDISLPLRFNGFHLLKVLSLEWVNLKDGALISLLTNFPLLEILSLLHCPQLSLIKVSASHFKLKSLSVVGCGEVDDTELTSPNLQSFHFFGDLLYRYVFINISSMVEVLMSSYGCENTEPEHDYIKISSDLMHVRTLCEGGRLCFFKECICPCLEKLFMYLFIPQRPRMKVEEPANFVFHSLKSPKISNFTGQKIKMRLLEFVLEKAIVLEDQVLVGSQNGIHGMNTDFKSQSKSINTPLKLLCEQLQLGTIRCSDSIV